MSVHFLLRRTCPVLVAPILFAQPAALPAVQEAVLPNGVRVLMVERPGTGVLHASLTCSRPLPDPTGAPAVAYGLLRDCLAAHEPAPRKGLEALLAREDGLWASLRLPGSQPLQDLQGLHAQVRHELEAGKGVGEAMSPATVAALSADDLHLGWDLPSARLEAWARDLAHRLKSMNLAAFPEVRDRRLRDAPLPTSGGWPRAMGLLLPAALGGGPYGTAAAQNPETVAEVRWEGLRALGRALIVPGRMTLVLVGDFQRDPVLAVLRGTLGGLPESREAAPSVWQGVDGFEEGWTGRRLQAFSEGEARLLVALRVPRAGGRDDRALRVLAEVLAGGPSSRLWRRLVVDQSLASRVTVRLGVPGVREAHLMVLEAEPAPGRTLPELEQGLQGELSRLLREGISREDVREAQLRVEAEETLVQGDAALLAQRLGEAQARTGQWAAAFPMLGGGARLPELGVHQLLRTLAHPSGVVTLCLEPDTLLTPQDPSEARLIRLLRDRVGRAVPDPVALDGIVRQSVQQLRLLSPAERTRILTLLDTESK